MKLTDDNKQGDSLTGYDQRSLSFSQMMQNTSVNATASMISSVECLRLIFINNTVRYFRK